MYCFTFSCTKGTKLKDKLTSCQHPSALSLGPIPGQAKHCHYRWLHSICCRTAASGRSGRTLGRYKELAAPSLCFIRTL